MSTKERLTLMEETNARNESSIRKWKLMNAHKAFVRDGKYNTATLLLRLLRRKVLKLGLNDDSTEIELFLDSMGFQPWYGRNYNTATYRLK